MAIKQTALCDRCGELIAGDGYSAAFYVGSLGATIKVKSKIAAHAVGNKHFCGQTCLIREISEVVGRLPNGRPKIDMFPINPRAKGAVGRTHRGRI